MFNLECLNPRWKCKSMHLANQITWALMPFFLKSRTNRLCRHCFDQWLRPKITWQLSRRQWGGNGSNVENVVQFLYQPRTTKAIGPQTDHASVLWYVNVEVVTSVKFSCMTSQSMYRHGIQAKVAWWECDPHKHWVSLGGNSSRTVMRTLTATYCSCGHVSCAMLAYNVFIVIISPCRF